MIIGLRGTLKTLGPVWKQLKENYPNNIEFDNRREGNTYQFITATINERTRELDDLSYFSHSKPYTDKLYIETIHKSRQTFLNKIRKAYEKSRRKTTV